MFYIFLPGKTAPWSSTFLISLFWSSLTKQLLYLGGAAGGGYAQVIPMEEVKHTDTLIAPRIKKASKA